jgi:hypothetical protein
MRDGEKQSVLVGITSDNEFVELEINNGNRGHFSCSTNTFFPVNLDTAIERHRDSMIDLYTRGEQFNNACDTDVEKHGDGSFTITKTVNVTRTEVYDHIDNSLCPMEILIDGDTYILESGSCGQVRSIHDRIDEYFLDQELHESILEQWDNHHLDNDFRTDLVLPDMNKRKLIKSTIKELVNEGVIN